ncbi:MAG: hypothetical protein KQJ78_09020 [Deltaproteobacteria bacterium]|nr:hypothetical protein [Deltaproteobacteria bacterium]
MSQPIWPRLLLPLMVWSCLLGGPGAVMAADLAWCTARVEVDGRYQGEVAYLNQHGQTLVDAQALLGLVDGAAGYAMAGDAGLVIQYGDDISFAGRNRQYGFIKSQKTDLLAPLAESGGRIFVPTGFLGSAISSDLSLVSGEQAVLSVQVNQAPHSTGYLVPQAAQLSQELSAEFTVRSGDINLTSAIDVFASGYTVDCNGNNAGFPYLVGQAPPSPRNDSYFNIPLVTQMDSDEAFVLIGYTPPEVEYYSYRSYLVDRFYEDTGARQKLYASLGDTLNNYLLADALGTDDVYQRFMVLISTGNEEVYNRVRDAAIACGIPAANIQQDIIPADMVNFGLGDTADTFSYLHRASLFKDPAAKDAYLNNPTLEFLRVTPKESLPLAPLSQEPLIDRETGVSEVAADPVLPAVQQKLYQAILAKHGAGKTAQLLDTYQWLEEGNEAIADRTNVLGESRDTLYTRTDDFTLGADDVAIVFGVNHSQTAKSVYSNVSCYGADYFNGFGGITNESYLGTAREYLPDLDPAVADMFYVWKFARSQLDEHTFVVPENLNGDYYGINLGDQAFMGFRDYINTLTDVGPALDELQLEQVLLFKGPGSDS